MRQGRGDRPTPYAALNRFAEGPYKVRVFRSNSFTVSKETLPKELEIYILKIAGFDLE